MGFTSLEDDKWSEAVLKIKYGGLGLTSVENTMPAAFVASWAHMVTELPKRFPHIADTVNKFVSEVAAKYFNSSCSDSSIGGSLATVIETLPPEHLENATEPKHRSCHDLFSKPTKLQHRLSDDIANSQADDLFETLTSSRDKARVKSIQGKGPVLGSRQFLHQVRTQ